MNESLNYYLFSLVNANPHTSRLMIDFASFIANGLFYILAIFLAVYWIIGNHNQKSLVLKSFCLSLVALGVAQIITHFYPHPRPFMVGVGHTFISHVADASFPSDHMTVFSSVAMAFLLGKKYVIGLVVMLSAWLVSWARVYLGVHFPFDIMGAFLMVVVVAYCFEPVWIHFGDKVLQPLLTLYQNSLNQLGLETKLTQAITHRVS